MVEEMMIDAIVTILAGCRMRITELDIYGVRSCMYASLELGNTLSVCTDERRDEYSPGSVELMAFEHRRIHAKNV